MSDYSLHSIGLLFFRRKQYDVFRTFLKDTFAIAGTRMISLLPFTARIYGSSDPNCSKVRS